MKEIVVISGKGGTGKTSITAALTYVGRGEILAADCDVDAADMHLLLAPDFGKPTDFYSGVIAKIDTEACISCGKCKAVCRFDAISIIDDKYVVSPLDCEGCGYCARVCPRDAITTPEQNVGQWFISTTRLQNQLVHARLGIGTENSGKLVAKVKAEARSLAIEKDIPYVLVDGSPGIGCPVISSLSGADYVVLVTEPTVSGLHDMRRVHQLLKQFNLPCGCVINKADLNPEFSRKIEGFLQDENIDLLARMPYHPDFTEAITQGKTIVELDGSELPEKIEILWNTIKSKLEE
ncbi:MAG: ATP-binding protein [Candidatus Cloacimonetes bacterium]|nr:ATP-binding protein [Candidatus Cloacimonadota bacterium]